MLVPTIRNNSEMSLNIEESQNSEKNHYQPRKHTKTYDNRENHCSLQ